MLEGLPVLRGTTRVPCCDAVSDDRLYSVSVEVEQQALKTFLAINDGLVFHERFLLIWTFTL